jgi:hypothetical protein
MRLTSWVICAGLIMAVAVSRAEAEPRLRVAGAKDGAIALVVRNGTVLKRTILIIADSMEWYTMSRVSWKLFWRLSQI